MATRFYDGLCSGNGVAETLCFLEFGQASLTKNFDLINPYITHSLLPCPILLVRLQTVHVVSYHAGRTVRLSTFSQSLMIGKFGFRSATYWIILWIIPLSLRLIERANQEYTALSGVTECDMSTACYAATLLIANTSFST